VSGFDLDMRSGVARYVGVAFLAALAVAVAACSQPPASAARSASGTSLVLGWGADAAGQLGDGKKTPRNDEPVQVRLPAGTKVTAVAAGGHHSLAVTSTGQVLTWGINLDGELGDGTSAQGVPHLHERPGGGNSADSDVPVQVKLPARAKVTAVAGGDAHSCSSAADGGYSLALTSTGSVLAWGGNQYGELGDGTSTNSDVPVQVRLPAGVKVTAVAAGGSQSLALTSTGQVLAWGGNAAGQLGDGSTAASDVPVKVRLPAGIKVTAIAGGCFQSLALTSTGQVLAWGGNAAGQLGDGSTAASDVPVKVRLPAGIKVTAVAAGGSQSLALTSTGQVLAWGGNAAGQLGDGSTAATDVPVTVKLPKGTEVTKLGAGSVGDYSLALVHHA
jgi:alpha-tubulin suppressor-like RCC1 family protein